MNKRLRIIISIFSGSMLSIRNSRMSWRTLQHTRRQPSRRKRLTPWACGKDASCRAWPKWCGADLRLQNLRLRQKVMWNVRFHPPRRKFLPVLCSTQMTPSQNIYLSVYRTPSFRFRLCCTQVCIIMQTRHSITRVPVTRSALSGDSAMHWPEQYCCVT